MEINLFSKIHKLSIVKVVWVDQSVSLGGQTVVDFRKLRVSLSLIGYCKRLFLLRVRWEPEESQALAHGKRFLRKQIREHERPVGGGPSF